jgi:hypothetical protein
MLATTIRVIATIFSGPLLILGVIWFGQGLNVLPGTFMKGDLKWAVIGAPMAVVGAILVWWLNRKPRAAS